jgi:hypothetical protein
MDFPFILKSTKKIIDELLEKNPSNYSTFNYLINFSIGTSNDDF